ncbi:MAG: methyltransferase [Gammaproteobacteria bacterium]|nr:methyltransferase [Gammaproteobacteria bacterium]
MSDNFAEKLNDLRADVIFDAHLNGFDLVFHSTWGVFSPRAIDEGTRLLLDHLNVARNADCIDLGCGYGPLGLVLARMAPGGTTHLIDKDFVAVDYARKNADKNNIENVQVYLSNGFSHVSADARFDVVVSNLPAKAGKELFYLYFYDALARMNPGAEFYVVTVNGLRGFVKRVFTEVFGNYRKLKQGKNYTVAVATRQSSA